MEYFYFTYSNYNYGGIRFPSILDLSLSLLWVLIVLGILYSYRQKKVNLIYKHYIPFFLFKIFAVFLFVVANSILYKGADSAAFWHLSNSLTDLLLRSPIEFFKEIIGITSTSIYKYGILHPGWIYREPEGFFMSKITWFFSFISGKQYLLASLYFALIGFWAQWRLYRLIMDNFVKNKESKLYLLFLYLPSVAYWCSGIAKDTVILISVLSISYYIIQWFILKNRKVNHLLGLLFFAFLLLKTREVILAIVLASFILMWVFTLVNSIKERAFRAFLRVSISFIGLIVFAFILFALNLTAALDGYLAEGEVIQQDFANNPTYTGKKYNLGITSFTPIGMIAASPLAIFTGIFRPGLWEAFTPTLILNGLEGTVLLFLFARKIVLKSARFMNTVMNHRLLLYSLILVLIYAFTTGFTSIVFGVLVRLRAPLLVFFAILLYWEDFSFKLGKSTLEEKMIDT